MCPNRKILIGLDVVAVSVLTFDPCPSGKALPLPCLGLSPSARRRRTHLVTGAFSPQA